MKIYNYSIVLSFLSLWLNSYFPSDNLYLLGFLMILTFGILHGANDILIINKSFKSLKNSPIYFLIGFYLTLVLSTALLFTFLPDFALLFFITISAYHFGEQHWHSVLSYTHKTIKLLFELLYGSFIFCLIFYFHVPEVEYIISNICHYAVNLSHIDYLLTINGLLMVFVGIYLYKTNKLFKMQIGEQLLYLLVLAMVFRVSSLIWSFAIYFVLWHSIPSLHDQITYLYHTVNKNTIIAYVKKAFVYWLVSIIGLVVLYLVFKDTKVFEALLFSFIAAITFPHVIVIFKMFTKKK